MSVFGCLANYGRVVDTSDIDTKTFRLIMCFLYKEDVRIQSIEGASNLLYAANRYNIQLLDKLCEKYLMKAVTDENIEELLAIADNYELNGLKRICKLQSARPNPELPAAWLRYDSEQFPDGALVAGYSTEGIPICIGRCIYEGSILPGAIDLLDETITVCHEGLAVKLKKFEILCNGNHYWSRSNLGRVFSDAVSGGTTELGETVYVGRVLHEGQLKIGKISPVSDHLFVSDGDKEIRVESGYEVLIEKPFNKIIAP